jgi:hypothetical protein
MILDVLLLLLMATIIVVATAQGFVRALVMALLFYLLSILFGMTMAGSGWAYSLNDQGTLFATVLVFTFAAGILLSHFFLGKTRIRQLKWGDTILGMLVGVMVALAFAAVICNAWGVIVRQPWRPWQTWLTMRITFQSSGLRPLMMDVLRLYRRMLFPFAASGYPIFFRPQG